MASSNFLISAGDNFGRSILIVSLLSFAVSGNGGSGVDVADVEGVAVVVGGPLVDELEEVLIKDQLAVHFILKKKNS